jgi:hypothetical protein
MAEPEAGTAVRGESGRDAVPDPVPDEIPDDEPIDQLLDDELSDDELRAAELRAPEPRVDDRDSRVHDRELEPEQPDLVDLDPETTAERIAALWRRPVGEGDTVDETESSVAGPSALSDRGMDDGPRYRPAGPEADPSGADYASADPSGADPFDAPRGESGRGAGPVEAARGATEVDPRSTPAPWAGPHPDDVDPTAATGDLSVADLGAEERRASPVNGHHLADHAPDDDRPDEGHDAHDDDPGRVPRARHSRDGGSVGVDGTPEPRDGGPSAPGAHQGAAAWPEAPAPSGTNGHRHVSDAGSSVDPATEPVTWPAEPAASGPRQWPGPDPVPGPTAAEITGPAEAVPGGAPTRPSGPSRDDSVDSQLSERERERLARLHDELASRERLEAGAPDPLLGRRGPGDEGAPGGPPPPGYRPGPERPPPGPPPGHANGHGLPPRPDPYPEDD